MEFNFVTNLQTCDFLINSFVPTRLILYSHVPTAIIALLIGFFVFIKNRKELAGKILFGIGIVFALWSLFDMITWFSRDSRVTMFAWALLGVLNILIYVLALYLTFVFIDKKDVYFKNKIILSILILPIIIFTPTVLNLTGFDATNCESIEGMYFTNYYHFLGFGMFVWLLVISILRYKKVPKDFKKQLIVFTLGVGFFLFSFFLTGFLSSYYDNFQLSIYGMFGMTFFMGFLAYLIVRYEAFNIRLIGSQALVATLIILIGSELFFVDSTMNIILVLITLGLSLGFGYMLIKSIGSEVKRKEELQDMADRLAQANDQLRKLDNAKTEFISIASHQLRTPLTSIKGFVSLVIEGSYGQVSDSVRDALTKVYASSERLIKLVEDLLNVSRIESGRMQFVFDKASIKDLMKELYDNFILVAKNKKLYLDLKIPKEKMTEVVMDSSKIHEVVSNLVDNALKYTERGGVTMKAEEINDTAIRITVSDTGIGVPAEEIQNLFKKFSRGKDTGRLHVGGTGLGLYVGKNIIDAHHGRIWVESDGEGRGSSFIIELPINQLI